MLLSARDEETGEGMTDDQLRVEVMTFLLAGQETTALALTWTWYLLSRHPDARRRLEEEIDSVLDGRPPEYTDLVNLPYTRMVVDETMRLYPPAWGFSRQALSDDQLGGFALPRGWLVFVIPYVLHRLPAFWEHPDAFDPERFSPERSADRPKFVYLPFSAGPRQCIGNQFALIEAQLTVATLAQAYRLHLAAESQSGAVAAGYAETAVRHAHDDRGSDARRPLRGLSVLVSMAGVVAALRGTESPGLGRESRPTRPRGTQTPAARSDAFRRRR